jgi:hypothetical protein
LPGSGTVDALAIDPQTPTTVYAGISGGGVFKSTDGGTSWTAINSGLTHLAVSTLAVDPNNPTIVYAGTKGGGVFSRTGDEQFMLTVGTTGDGAGTVSSSPSGIECGTDCSELYTSGSTVTLIAARSAGSLFTGWSGCERVDGPTCTVTMTAATNVTATFVLQRFTLTVSTSGLGKGRVTSSSPGIDCGSDCSETYVSGTTVTLRASPALGSIFMGWDGCDTVSGSTCTVTMNAERSVTASFLGVPLFTPPIGARFGVGQVRWGMFSCPIPCASVRHTVIRRAWTRLGSLPWRSASRRAGQAATARRQ